MFLCTGASWDWVKLLDPDCCCLESVGSGILEHPDYDLPQRMVAASSFSRIVRRCTNASAVHARCIAISFEPLGPAGGDRSIR